MDNNKITITHNAGFFSCCTIRLRTIIDYYNQYNILPVVDSSSQWKHYKDDNSDITKKFFKDNDYIFDTPNVKFINTETEDQFSNYNLINFDSITHFIKKYFSLSNEIELITNQIISNYNINLNNTLSVFYRGNDKIEETILPSYDEYYNTIKYRLNLNPNLKILIQSDEKEFYEFISNKFPSSIIIDEMPRFNKGNYNDINMLPIGKKTYYAQLFLSIVSLISKSNHIIINSGNVGMWITLFRGNTINVSQYLNPKIKNNTAINSNWIHN